MGKRAKAPASKSSATAENKPTKGTTCGSSSSSDTNRPRNHLITDATQPFGFNFSRYGLNYKVTVHQTPDEDTWPGGALWDLGVLLSQVLVEWTRGASIPSKKSACPSRLLQVGDFHWKDLRVLELGCGVGLTGLVAAALGAKVTLLTDLDVVVDNVSRPNTELNTLPGPNKTCGYRVTKAGGEIMAMPLCWGNENDERNAIEALESLTPPVQSARKTSTKESNEGSRNGKPDLIIIGDVAYQHKPGAPSHFDVLLSTLLKFVDDKTIVLFGTRMRMPASADLLTMFREHLDELVDPPVEAHELDPSFATDELGKRHNMTIHVLRLKQRL
jgi:predicted nicotinamide N-methyase